MDGGGGVLLAQAVSDLVNAGFVVTEQRGQWSSTVPIGYAITSVPAPGSVVPYGTALILYYSLGPQPVPQGGVVPNVIGLPYVQARALIAAVPGIGVTNPIYVQSPFPVGTVIGQSFVGLAAYGTQVTLTIAATQVSYVADGNQTVPNPL